MHIHILGICGTFMGGVAALAREAGHRVTGCDAGVYPPMSEQLKSLGIELIEGFDASQTQLNPDVYVVGNVVGRANLNDGTPKFPLMETILDQGLPYISGPQWLAENVLHGRHVLAVAGTHGKTSTASMLAWILEQAQLETGFLIGGVPLNFGVSARLGKQTNKQERPFFVIEADEYDTAFFDKRSKFVHYRPRTVILNNLEFDHADIFNSVHDIERQFHHLLRIIPSTGDVVANGLEAHITNVLHQGCYSHLHTFGGAVSDYTAQGTASDFAVLHRGKKVAQVQWSLIGTHNQLNALAAITAAATIGVSPQAAAQALSSFQNARRRMEIAGAISCGQGKIVVYDDFAHHPTAIRTTIDGLYAMFNHTQNTQKQRIVAVFEPRSNTMQLGEMKAQLPWAFEHADSVFCYANQLGWNAAEVLQPLASRAQVIDNIDVLVQTIANTSQAGDHIVCMSNGGFDSIHQRLLQALSH